MAVKSAHRNRVSIIVSIVAISFIQGLQFGVAPILGQIGAHFSQIDRSFIQMLITAPALLSMIVALLSGSLVMIIGKKKLLVFAGFVFGKVSTNNVYKIAVIGMSISAVILAIYKNVDNRGGIKNE